MENEAIRKSPRSASINVLDIDVHEWNSIGNYVIGFSLLSAYPRIEATFIEWIVEQTNEY
jgi:hypothetical protein